MSPNSRTSTCRLLGVAVALSLVTSRAVAQSRPTDALRWLTGCWEWRTPNSVVEEHWSSPSGGMLLGSSKTVRNDSVREYEFVRIYDVGDTLIYDAQPSRQPRAEFRAIPPFEPEIVFANPAHDFPQRIRYRRVGSDTLIARIEGMRNGQARARDFPYRRVSCDSK